MLALKLPLLLKLVVGSQQLPGVAKDGTEAEDAVPVELLVRKRNRVGSVWVNGKKTSELHADYEIQDFNEGPPLVVDAVVVAHLPTDVLRDGPDDLLLARDRAHSLESGVRVVVHA